MIDQDSFRSLNLQDFELFFDNTNSSLENVKKWIENDKPNEGEINKRIQMRFIELRDDANGKLKKSGVFLDEKKPSSESSQEIKITKFNKSIFEDLSKL